MLCGDAAHLHEKVLSEVVLGEFHAAIRALEVIDLVEELQVGPKKKGRRGRRGNMRGGGKKGGFSHLEIRADYGQVSA